MTLKPLIAVAAASALFAGCAKHDEMPKTDTATAPAETTPPPADTAPPPADTTTPPADTSTTPGGTAGDTATPPPTEKPPGN